MTDCDAIRLGDRVRIGASQRIGRIKSFYDGPYEGPPQDRRATYALVATTDAAGNPGGYDARPLADLHLEPTPNGDSA